MLGLRLYYYWGIVASLFRVPVDRFAEISAEIHFGDIGEILREISLRLLLVMRAILIYRARCVTILASIIVLVNVRRAAKISIRIIIITGYEKPLTSTSLCLC